jgi:hypothetical protein
MGELEINFIQLLSREPFAVKIAAMVEFGEVSVLGACCVLPDYVFDPRAEN